MSVLVCRRKESRLEVIVFAEKLRSELIDLTHRTFGIKNLEHLLRPEKARGQLKKKDIDFYCSVLQLSKESVLRAATMLTDNVSAANSIYPILDAEWEQRRIYQDNAIANCRQIIKELQHVVAIFDIDINTYERYINDINREIGLIKNWRQKDYNLCHSKKGNI